MPQATVHLSISSQPFTAPPPALRQPSTNNPPPTTTEVNDAESTIEVNQYLRMYRGEPQSRESRPKSTMGSSQFEDNTRRTPGGPGLVVGVAPPVEDSERRGQQGGVSPVKSKGALSALCVVH